MSDNLFQYIQSHISKYKNGYFKGNVQISPTDDGGLIVYDIRNTGLGVQQVYFVVKPSELSFQVLQSKLNSGELTSLEQVIDAITTEITNRWEV